MNPPGILTLKTRLRASFTDLLNLLEAEGRTEDLNKAFGLFERVMRILFNVIERGRQSPPSTRPPRRRRGNTPPTGPRRIRRAPRAA